MKLLNGFWSYVHADDQAEGERISRLAKDVIAQFEALTGETISLFLDKDDIAWGENWREKVDSNLSSVAFFIPVLTPRYLMSPECRRELQFFVRKAIELGISELILPLLYIDFPALHDETSSDDLITQVRKFQWENWQDLRFLDVTSEGYRRGVARLAARLVEANRQTEIPATTIEPPVTEVPENRIDDSPGFIDKLAIFEETLPKIGDTVSAISKYIEEIGKIMKEATNDINRGKSQGRGFAPRLLIVHRLMSQMSEPAEHIWSLSNEYASQLHKVDDGIRIIIEHAPVEIQENPDSKKYYCNLFESLRYLSKSSNDGLSSIQLLISSSEPLEKMSRELRPVIRRLRQGLTIMVESRTVIEEWVRLTESSGIGCEGPDSQA